MPVLLMTFLVLGAVGLYLALPGKGRIVSRAGLVLLAGAGATVLGLLVPLAPKAAPVVTFCVLAAVGLFGAVRVITHERAVYCALFFMLVVVSVAGLLILSDAKFIGIAILIVYGGAILVTYLFVIMLAQQGADPPRYDLRSHDPLLGVLGGFLMLGVLSGHLLAGPVEASPATEVPATVLPVATVLLTEYVVGVQIAGVLLLAAMVGALALARRPASTSDEQEAA